MIIYQNLVLHTFSHLHKYSLLTKKKKSLKFLQKYAIKIPKSFSKSSNKSLKTLKIT